MTKFFNNALWCVAILYAAAVICSGLIQPVGTFDEPLPWVSALQIRRGLVAHTGFWSTYPPLTSWLLAGVFSVLGETAIAARLLGVFFFVLLLAGVALLHRRKFAPYAVLMATFGAGPLFIYAFGIALAASLCAVLSHFILSRSRPVLALIPGVLLGVAVLMRLNFAAYAAAAIVLDLILVKQMKRIGFILGPIVVALLAYLLPYGAGVGQVLQQIAIVPQQVLAPVRFIPLPNDPVYYAALALPLVWYALRSSSMTALLAAAGVCLTAYLCRSSAALLPAVSVPIVAAIIFFDHYGYRLDHIERGFLILYSLFLHYFLWRADEWHLRALIGVAGLLLPFTVLAQPKKRIPMLLLLPVIAAASWHLHTFRPQAAASLATLRLMLRGDLLDRTPDSARFLGRPVATIAEDWRRVYPVASELSALRYVYSRTQENDCVYVGVPNHGAVFVGDIRAYWLLHRCIGVNRFILEPGITTTAEAESQMLQELEDRHVRWLVLTPPEKGDQAFLSHPTAGSDILDAAIASRYRTAATLGSYVVLTTIR